MAQLLSVNVGLPHDVGWKGRTVHTAVWKEPVAGKRLVRRLNIDGDGQGDRVGHGGEQRAVLVYQIDSYRYWERQMGRSDFVYGQFGENFTVDGLADDEVCIGDRYRIGSAVFEVTQPRVTCYRVGIRIGEPQMAALLVAHRRPGFYLRVLQEGEVEAGDEIVKIADGPEGLTVVATDALLYLPGHDRTQLERALRIPTLSEGWKSSLEALLDQRHEGGRTGNAGLALDTGPPPAWPGFRPMSVRTVRTESRTVFSLELEPAEGGPIAPAAPGQFVTLRVPAETRSPPLLRSYSLSGPSRGPGYRISIKLEPHGVVGHYLRGHVRAGTTLDVAAPRGAFILRPDARPVVLLSAGIGATPVLAMLHALTTEASGRTVWWIHGARNGEEDPFAREVDGLLEVLPDRHRFIAYSQPLATDRLGTDFDLAGRLDAEVLRRLGVPHDADFYLCGPNGFMRDLTAGLATWEVPSERVRTEIFGPGPPLAPGIIDQIGREARRPHPPSAMPGAGPAVSFARSGLTVPWSDEYASLLELADACDVTVRWSCRTGVCHTCASGLLAGAIAYQPEPLEHPGEDNVLVCCAQPRTDVAIDI
jgi:ferredoxin-NADP reductase/MOSC domain-containing protein YiiM/ferredoxin